MAFNGSGVYNRIYNWVTDRTNGIKILASRMDAEMDGFATGLSNTICRDGQSTITQDIPFNNRKITGLANATADADALNRITADGRFLPLTTTPPVTGDGLVYDGSEWVPGAPTVGGASLSVSGLTMSTDGANAVSVNIGTAVASTGNLLRLTSATAKLLSATFVAGNGNGGLDTGSEASTTWYHVHLIGNLTTGAVDVLLSTSFSSPTLPSGFTVSVVIGAVYNNSSSNIVTFMQQGDHFFYTSNPPPADAAITNLASASGTLIALTVPSGVRTIACVNFWFADSTSSQVWLTSPDTPDVGVSPTAGRADAPHTGGGGAKYVSTDTSRQIRARGSSGTAGQIYLTTLGFIYPRGGQ